MLYTKSALQSCVGGRGGGISPQPPPVCSIHLDDATAATGQQHQCATGGEERVIVPIKCMLSPKPATGGEEREDIDPIKCMRSPHTSYRWRGESHSANQVYALTTHQLQVERRES